MARDLGFASRIVGTLIFRLGLFQLPILVAVLAYPSFLAEALAIPFFLEKLMMIPGSMIILEAFLLIMNRHAAGSSTSGPTPRPGPGSSVGAGGLDADARCCSPRGLCGTMVMFACACCVRVPFIFRLLLVYLVQITQISLILENDVTQNHTMEQQLGRLKPFSNKYLPGHTGAYVGDSLVSGGGGETGARAEVKEEHEVEDLGRRRPEQMRQNSLRPGDTFAKKDGGRISGGYDPQKNEDVQEDSRSQSQQQAGAAGGGASQTGGAGADPMPTKPLTTMSVVLPCAGEGKYALKTAESVFKSFPNTDPRYQLKEIVVVDDGTNPPLEDEWLPKDVQQKYKVRIIRNQETLGLIGAKRVGGNAAKGEIITFFDCHVAPQDDWYKSFFDSINENPKRIVMPVLTDLDIDTWTERARNSGMAKCYLTFDADFKWFNSDNDDIPILSGGLLALSKYWWEQTGGYDEVMRGWGGENLDQSLRSWLCGGEIVSLPKAFVAHMWRVGHDSRTAAQYRVPPGATAINRYRAAKAWMEPYVSKMKDEFS